MLFKKFIFTMILASTSLFANASLILYGVAHSGPSGPSTLYTIDSVTGAATSVGDIGFLGVGGIDFAADGSLYGISRSGGSENLISIDPTTGVGSLIALSSIARFDLSFRNGDGTLFGAGFSPSGPSCVGLSTIDTTSGVATALPTSNTCSPGNGLAFSATDILYHVDITLGLNTIDQITGGVLSSIGISFIGFPDTSNSIRINAMDFHPTSDVLYVSANGGSAGGGPNFLATLDISSGVVTNIGLSVAGLDGLAWSPATAVPEPSTLVIFALGIMGLASCRFKKQS